MGKYLLICFWVAFTVIVVDFLEGPAARASTYKQPRTSCYALEFTEEFYVKNNDAVEINYETDDVLLGTYDNACSFKVDNSIFYIADSNFDTSQYEHCYSFKDCYIICESALDLLKLPTLLSSEECNSVIQVPNVELSWNALKELLPEDFDETPEMDYAIVLLENNEYATVCRISDETGIKYVVSDNIKGNWWISPLSMLCIEETGESYLLEFNNNSGFSMK